MLSKRIKELIKLTILGFLFLWFSVQLLILLLWIFNLLNSSQAFNWNYSPHHFWFLNTIYLTSILLYLFTKQYLNCKRIDLLEIEHERKRITIEPILDFDLEEVLSNIKNINPEKVYIGNIYSDSLKNWNVIIGCKFDSINKKKNKEV